MNKEKIYKAVYPAIFMFAGMGFAIHTQFTNWWWATIVYANVAFYIFYIKFTLKENKKEMSEVDKVIKYGEKAVSKHE